MGSIIHTIGNSGPPNLPFEYCLFWSTEPLGLRASSFASLAHVSPCQRVPSSLTSGSATLSLQLGEPNMQQRPPLRGEDAGVLGRRELNAVALGELGALDRVSAMQEHRADMLEDVLIGFRKELRQTLDLDHQTRKTLRHARKPKRGT